MRIISIIYDQIIDSFLSDLKLSGLSQNSIKFYKSDISFFIAWYKSELRKTGILAESFKELLPFLKPSVSIHFKDSLISNNVPEVSINRRLSVVRRFSDFLYSKELLTFDFAKDLENISTSPSKKSVNFHSVVDEFKKHLEANNASENTIKNYLADIRHFLNWIDSHHATT